MSQSAVNRRQFLGRSTLSLGGVALAPYFSGRALADDRTDPHFFLMVVAEGGLDNSYHFDARPLAMTRAGEIANYLGEDPWLWQGRNGQATWATRLVNPLKPFADDFSVINGVVMAPGFDGHDQNMNALITANPFGGNSFIPTLNQQISSEPTPLDFIETGRRHGEFHNGGAGIPMSPSAATNLQNRIALAPQLPPQSPLGQFIASRMGDVATSGTGKFARAAGEMSNAFGKTGNLREILQGLEPPSSEDDRFAANLQVIASFFKQGAARSATLDLEQLQDGQGNTLFVDTHSPDDAAKSDALVSGYINQIAQVFDFLKTTAFDETRSLLDVTTVMVSSEFTRTMRQDGMPIDRTGTDHNPLNNTILLGGKAIHGGLVLGESDRRTPAETISDAHAQLDFAALKLMGKPFDFASGTPRSDLPVDFRGNEYITAPSVTNTVLSAFGIGEALHGTAERNGGPAPVLTQLLS